MKTLLLVLAVLTLSFTAGKADSSVPLRLGLLAIPSAIPAANNGFIAVPKLTLAPLPGTSTSTLPNSPSEFAQLSSQNRPLPISSGLVLAFIAIFVLALRIMGLNHARAMADHERDSHRGKAQMFQSLHAERSER